MHLVVLSNRGPLSWAVVDGVLQARRGAGGLVSALGPALAMSGGTWIATALSEADREAARTGAGAPDAGYDVRLLDFDPSDQTAYLDVIANGYLWFAHHDLWNRPREPEIDAAAWEAWAAYQRVNTRFAEAALDALGDARDGVVLVQDYHLALVPAMVKAARPDVPVGHFCHTPFAPVSALEVLPIEWRRRLVDGMAAADVCGFHTRRWAARFNSVAPGARTGVFPLGPDPEVLAREASLPEVAAERAALEERLGGRRAVVRVDRAELSKNVLRGLRAFDALLDGRPELIDTVAHVVLLNPSRQALNSYREYLNDCVLKVEEINERRAREVVILHVEDRYPRSLAAARLAETILVNPISDGMNLVAKEAPLLNEHNAPLVLSTEAGAYEELEPWALGVNPYDVAATAAALATSLDMTADERRTRAEGVRAAAASHPPALWLEQQLEALTR